jgi:hypothetical protein
MQMNFVIYFIWGICLTTVCPWSLPIPIFSCNWAISNQGQDYAPPSGGHEEGIFGNQKEIKARGSETVIESHKVWP